MEQKAIIETRNLTKSYGEQVAVDDLSFTIEEGEIFGFLGPNGSGKTTTLLMLLGLTEPSGGWAKVAEFDPTREAIKVKRIVGYIPENMGFYDDMNARENLRFIALLNNIPDSVSLEKIGDALERVGLNEEAGKKVGAYSRGMRQRLGIAEILIKEPKIAFLDEPTLGLDPDGTTRIIEYIQSLSKDNNITILLSSHDLKQVQKISDRIGIMINGRMIALGPIETLAKEKFGLDEGEISLDDVYMKYFKEVSA
ncbi:MAG: ABC transporter ATP-binding protein [Deltaproteobacteria bacterium]|nr:ABC transporter ATP-binding protein [Deltaproteobacteria bacterium]RLB31279.1 MAG: ABC transporter ATP-binding protein [Deltaproteobacteria bacterium]